MKKKRRKRLDGWKEIAGYLNRDARTVMRWEKAFGLPVHRMEAKGKSTIYALSEEIDAWLAAPPCPVELKLTILKTRRSWWLCHLIFVTLLATFFLLWLSPRLKTLPEPVDFDISGSKLIILDKKGKKSGTTMQKENWLPISGFIPEIIAPSSSLTLIMMERRRSYSPLDFTVQNSHPPL